MRLQRFSLARSDLSKLNICAARPAAELVLYFGSRAGITSEKPFARLKTAFPDATIVGCSTGGQIRGDELIDDDIEVVAMSFESTRISLASEVLASAEESRQCGCRIGERLKSAGLAGILVLADGLNVNGGDLVAGITSVVGPEIPLIGGLAGDGADFVETLVGADGAPQTKLVAAIGFYGDAVRFGHGSAGGWDVFGSWRTITHSRKNVLFQLDGEPALDLYERYLGDEAKSLPGTGLRFPLQVMDPENPDRKIIRTILSIDRDQRSLTFAGDVPEGWHARLMRGVFDHLVLGAKEAARQAKCGTVESFNGGRLALLVSCIGRRVLMGQRITEEIEAALTELGDDFAPFGFYSYGEIAPQAGSGICELHNQTMTITTIAETSVV